MIPQTTAEGVGALEKTKSHLQSLANTADGEIASVSRGFAALAAHTDVIVGLAAAIVSSAQDESVSSVLPKVQSLGAAARGFIADRLQATTGILETVGQEVKLLGQLSLVTRGQAAVARETKVLSVLTNIEVARLGAVGAGFQYLAQELADFSKSVADDTQALLTHTDGRKSAIEETRRTLSNELPRLRLDLGHIETDLGSALAGVEAGLKQLAQTPDQFKVSVEEIARQIAGVVAAVQVHDITRQQIEHVQAAFAIISESLRAGEDMNGGSSEEFSRSHAGLTIQIYQLRAIKETVAAWAAQIRTCMDAILNISASEVVCIGPLVLEQSRSVASHLTYIESLESKSQAYSERIRSTLEGLSNLMQLVSDHLARSKSVHERLQLLTFNSIIEANRLGKQASAIMAIAKSIEGISVKWSLVTEQSRQALREITALVKHTNQVMEVFSEAGNEKLREAQNQTRAGLTHLQSAATVVGKKAQEMNMATQRMQSRMTGIRKSSELLDACFGRFERLIAEIEAVKHQLENNHPGSTERYDEAGIGQLFSSFYTTEIERAVLHAALHGAPLPPQPALAGNSMELF